MPVTLLYALLFGCASPPEKLESVPAVPTVELGGDVPQSEITWSELQGLLPEGEPGVPAALGVTLGMAEPEARAAFEAARHKKLPHPADREFEGVGLMAGRLDAFPAAGATLMFRDGVLFAIDLSLPREEAGFATTEMWGKPDTSEAVDEGPPHPVWTHDGLRAVLIEVDGKDAAILKLTREK